MGNVLVDTESQVSLVTERSLNEISRIKRHVLKIHGIRATPWKPLGK